MKKLLALLILVVAATITAALIWLKPTAAEVTPARPVPTVEIIRAQPQSIQLTVRSQGTVLPRTETELTVDVSGRILEIADNFRAGGQIEAGDVLLRIDPVDYQTALAARAADLASARLALAQEQALSEQAAADWQAVGEGTPSALTLRQPQLALANARVVSAEAMLQQAERDLARTEVKAPYRGRVLSKSVDLGQYVSASPAAPIARIYATDRAEIRLPVTEREASLLQPDAADAARLDVRITHANKLQAHVWQGKLSRMEATIDPANRLLYAVAEVQDPFTEPQLRRGQFVHAAIAGKVIEQAYSIPRYALRGSDTVYIASAESTLQTRRIDIVNSDAQQVIIRAGLQAGERVVVSPIAYFIENMPVEVIELR
jgi:RND family efflux transporter MFP subunit